MKSFYNTLYITVFIILLFFRFNVQKLFLFTGDGRRRASDFIFTMCKIFTESLPHSLERQYIDRNSVLLGPTWEGYGSSRHYIVEGCFSSVANKKSCFVLEIHNSVRSIWTKDGKVYIQNAKWNTNTLTTRFFFVLNVIHIYTYIWTLLFYHTLLFNLIYNVFFLT